MNILAVVALVLSSLLTPALVLPTPAAVIVSAVHAEQQPPAYCPSNNCFEMKQGQTAVVVALKTGGPNTHSRGTITVNRDRTVTFRGEGSMAAAGTHKRTFEELKNGHTIVAAGITVRVVTRYRAEVRLGRWTGKYLPVDSVQVGYSNPGHYALR